MDIKEVINQFVADCEIRGLTGETLLWYRKRLGVFARKLEEVCKVTDINEVKITHLRQFVLHMMSAKYGENNPRTPTQNKPLSAFTVRGYVRAVKVFFGWCVDEELLTSDPSSRLVQPKAPDYIIPTFTTEHIEMMLAVCDTSTPEGFRNYVLTLLLLDTGMRASELCSLKVTDVHDHYVKVFGKGRKEREIGLHPEVSKLLWRYIHMYRKPIQFDEPILFIGRGGKPLKYEAVRAILKGIRKKSGVSEVRLSAHTFRHTFAKFYLKRGGELFKLSREMGHSSIQVTELYLKDFHSSDARKEHTTYSPLNEIDLPKKKRKNRRKGK